MRLVGENGSLVSQPIDVETASGLDVLQSVASDGTPELGGDLDVLTRAIVSSSNRDITLKPDGTGQVVIQKTDDGATANPVLEFQRASASPAADDLLGNIAFMGNDSAGNLDTYASIEGRIGRTNTGSERGLINFNALNNGSNELVMTMGRNGLFMGASNVVAFEKSDGSDVFTSLTIADPSSDRTITFPDATGTVMLNTDSSFTNNLTVTKADDGAAQGPEFILTRTSASPAANDLIGSIVFKAQDSAGNTDTYAEITGEIERTNSGSERGRIDFDVVANGSMETIATFNRNGLFFGAGNKVALGGDSANFFTSIYPVDPTADRTITLPDASGTVLLSSGTTTALTGDIDLGGQKIITSASNNNIELDPHGTGKVILTGPVDIEGLRANSNSMFINTDMSSDLTDDLHNVIECQSDYTGSTIGSGTRQQSITFKFKDDAVDRQAGRFNCEFTSTDPSQNKMKLIAIDHAGSPSNGQIDVTPKRGAINVPFELPTYAVGSLPTSGIGAGATAYATGLNSSDVSTGKALVFYDGSNWKYTHAPATTARS